MVQLPATAAIEYVTTCCITRTRTITKTKTKTKTKTRTKIRTRTRTRTKTGTKTKIGTITRTKTNTKTKTKTESKTRTKIRTRTKTRTKTGTITKIVRGAYAHSPQVQCLYAPSRLSVPSVVAWRTNKNNRQTRPPSSAGSRPPSPNIQDM